MNRADRRKQQSGNRRHDPFVRNRVFEMRVVPRHEAIRLWRAARQGDMSAREFIEGADQFLSRVADVNRSTMLCCCCDNELPRDKQVDALVWTRGPIEPDGHAISGLCASCASKDDTWLQRAIFESLRERVPDLRPLDIGNIVSEFGNA
jgi:hypothetical protein